MQCNTTEPLDKTQQRSNWARRPLNALQLHYGALDAHCEVLIWDLIVESIGVSRSSKNGSIGSRIGGGSSVDGVTDGSINGDGGSGIADGGGRGDIKVDAHEVAALRTAIFGSIYDIE
jgi:hypothetical protein